MKQLITAHSLIIDDNGQPLVLNNYGLIIENDQIDAILPREEALTASFDHHIDLADHIVAPGLINTHGHAAMTLLRGFSDDQDLQTWLENHIWPAEQQWLSDDFVEDGTQLAIAEMLLSGTTCFSDMYFFAEAAVKAVTSSGIRAQIAFPIVDFPSNWGNGPDDYINKGLALHDQFKNSDMVHIAFGPHAPYTVSNGVFQRIATIAHELDAAIHVHLHETEYEVSQSEEQFGQRPIARLEALGILGEKTQCVHMTTLNEEDIAAIKRNKSHVVHCPQSNQKLASGYCPVSQLQANNINVSLGTDGAASNNSLNLFAELKHAALLAKLQTQNPKALDAAKAFNMATINGAKTLGIDHLTGSIAVGKKADIIAIPINTPSMTPLYSPLSQWVYSEAKPSHVWVNGKLLVNEGHLTQQNLSHIIQKAQQWADKIAL